MKATLVPSVVGAVVVAIGMLLVGLASRHEQPQDPVAVYPHGEAQVTSRLPRVAHPMSYDLFLRVVLPSNTPYVLGTVEIDTVFDSATPYLYLNAGENIQIMSAVWIPEGHPLGAPGEAVTVTHNKDAQEVLVDFGGRVMVAGARGKLHVEFDFALSESPLRGMYLALVDATGGADGGPEYMAVTQFEPTDARRMFPCFDEPAYKARYSISISHQSSYTALANTPVASTMDDPVPGFASLGYVVTSFEESPLMSSYLVAVAVGAFDYVSDITTSGVDVKVYTPKGLSSQATFALDTATRVLAYFESWYGIPYPLAKLDLLAVPSFAAGAMENWGLITGRYSAFLVTSDASAAAHYRVALVVAHECAHLWSGDLVSMEWFNDLWLNEGFASYGQYVGMDALYPAWKVWDVFLNDEQGPAFVEDAAPSTHSLAVPASMPVEDINSLFDSVSYGKGASIIRMLDDYFSRTESLGPSIFTTGLTEYLSAHAYGNAVTADLWASMSKASGLDIGVFMEAWTHSPGFPVVSVDASQCREGVPCSVTLSQERFLSTGDELPPNDRPYWHVPVAYQAGTLGEPSMIVIPGTESVTMGVTISGSPGLPVFLANVGRGGYYIVNYTDSAWEALTTGLAANPGLIPTVDKSGLIHDAFTMARDVQLDVSVAMDLTDAVFKGKTETSYPLWSMALSMLGDQEARFARANLISGSSATTKAWIISVMNTTLYEVVAKSSATGQLSFLAADNPHASASAGRGAEELRRIMLTMGLAVEHPGVVAAADAAYAAFQSDESANALDPALVPALYAFVVSKRGAYDAMRARAINHRTSDPADVRAALYALAHAGTSVNLNRAVVDLLDTAVVPSQEFPSMIVRIAHNVGAGGREAAWAFLQQHWDDVILARYGDGGFGLDRIITGIVGVFDTVEALAEVQAFFASHMPEHATGSVARAEETVRVNIKWVETVAPQLRDATASTGA